MTDTPAVPLFMFRRLMAALYDFLLVISLWFIATALATTLAGGPIQSGSRLFQLYLFFTPYVFFSWFWCHGGQTLGMRAWRLQLRSSDGQPVRLWQTLVRYVVAWISWFSVMGIVWCLIDARQRSWHGVASRTEMVLLPKTKAASKDAV